MEENFDTVVLCFVTGRSGTSVLLYQEASAAPNSQLLRQRHFSVGKDAAGVLAAVCCGSGRSSVYRLPVLNC